MKGKSIVARDIYAPWQMNRFDGFLKDIEWATTFLTAIKRWLHQKLLVDCNISKTTWTNPRHMVDKLLWHISDFVFVSYTLVLQNFLILCQIFVICGKHGFSCFIRSKPRLKGIENSNTFVEMLFLVKQWAVMGSVASMTLWCWRPFTWRKAKNLQTAESEAFLMRSRAKHKDHFDQHLELSTKASPSQFIVGSDSKTSNLGFLWFESTRGWVSLVALWTTAWMAQNELISFFFTISSYMIENDPLQGLEV